MTSKVTTDSERARARALEEFLPASVNVKSVSSESTAGVETVQTQESTTGSDNNRSIYSIHTKDTVDTQETIDTLHTEMKEATVPTASRRITGKQRKESLEEYRATFLQVPKLEDRKSVFVSCEVRDRLDEIVRRLGGRKMSVSGFIENLALHHLESYREDLEVWKKL
jgi:hypothetical protein